MSTWYNRETVFLDRAKGCTCTHTVAQALLHSLVMLMHCDWPLPPSFPRKKILRYQIQVFGSNCDTTNRPSSATDIIANPR